jgi:PAS domain S-box-containing protein
MATLLKSTHNLEQINPSEVALVIQAAADLSLVLNSNGEVISIAYGNPELHDPIFDQWIGKNWVDTVTVESRNKVQTLIKDAEPRSLTRFRQINVATSKGIDLPLLCATLKIASSGQIIVLSRDLSEISQLQQRLIDAQQSIEKDYTRLRQLETRYRVLFEMASEAVLVIDANTFKIVEANPRAANVIGESIKKLINHSLIDLLAKGDRIQAQSILSKVTYTNNSAELETKLPNGQNILLSASPFRNENKSFILLAFRPSGDLITKHSNESSSLLIQALDNAPDSFIVTNMAGKILSANQAFLRLVMADKLDQINNQSLERWLERAGVDLRVMLSNLQDKGFIKLFSTSVRDNYGTMHPVEISAVAVPYPHACLGFTIREIGSRINSKPQNNDSISRSSEELTQLVGRLPLKDIINETTDLIEQLCIKAALELTRGNRVSASEMLGLSRQSLYIKLRKYNLGDLSRDTEVDEEA